MGVETTRTTVLPLTLRRDETERVLHATAAQYYWCHNQTSTHCWGTADEQPNHPGDLKPSTRAVRDDIYDRLKRETDDLNANLVQAAIKQTVENVATLQTQWEKGRAHQPTRIHDRRRLDAPLRQTLGHVLQTRARTVAGRRRPTPRPVRPA